ncbi:MAG: DHHA1 domain-containing protein, partial [Gemmatimonadota bacterium]
FPLDLTELMAGERGYDVDTEGFDRALEVQRQRSREGSVMPGLGGAGASALDEGMLRAAQTLGSDANASSGSGGSAGGSSRQNFVGYGELVVETPVLAYARPAGGDAGLFLLERNPFYHEAGGQVSDAGRLAGDGWTAEVQAITKNERGQTVVAARATEGALPETVDAVRAEVAERVRHDTERNHTATHLLHAALRRTLGEHVHQAGSLVAPDRLRFDFSHSGPVTAEELSRIERDVNEAILANASVGTEERPYREALEAGAMALFGEKYGDRVRVVSVPGVSLELCGGCHVRTTGQIGQFRIVSETSVAAGIRRIEAVTGRRAWQLARHAEAELAELAATLRTPRRDLPRRVEALLAEIEALQGAAASLRGAESADEAARLVEAAEDMAGGGRLAHGRVDVAGGTDLSDFGDQLRARLESGAAIVHVSEAGGKDAFLAVVTDDWIARGLKAGDLVRTASKKTGSGGGGRPHLAQGGVGDAGQVDSALEAAVGQARETAATAGGGS